MLSLDAIRDCLEGVIPSAVATCAADGTPNVAYVSQVHYVDPSHVALSFQFFNNTRENVLANPRVTSLVIHPETAVQYSLELGYLRTETSGPLFESMRAKLAGIASHTGMTGVFALRGSDVYRVIAIAALPGKSIPAQPRPSLLPGLRACAERLASHTDLSGLLDDILLCLESQFLIRQSMVLLLDRRAKRFYTVASRGYPESGVGSEIAVGCGVIGVAAEQRTPIRIVHTTAEYSYSRAIRDNLEREGAGSRLETEIPFPGLPDPGSQLAAPIMTGREVLGVLYVESIEELRFRYDHEDALVAIASQMGTAIRALQQAAESEAAPDGSGGGASVAGAAVAIRHYAADDSIFIAADYLIKGVAGAIFWKLLRDHSNGQRTEFTNRELRLDSSLGLPDITDNLEARLILLERRLAEKQAPLRIEKSGRGRFRLRVDRPFVLSEMA